MRRGNRVQPPAMAGMMLTSSSRPTGRGQVVEVADVFVVDVDVDKPAELPRRRTGGRGARGADGRGRRGLRRRSRRRLRPRPAAGVRSQRGRDLTRGIMGKYPASGARSDGWIGRADAGSRPRVRATDGRSERASGACRPARTGRRRRQASNSSRVGLMTTGRARWSTRASWVFRPLPVMQRTVEPSRSIWPCSISLRATATVTPPAVSAKTPSVSASSCMPSTISSSSTSSPQPPVSRISFEAK